MRAMVYSRYGSPEDLHLQEVAKPAPEANEVLIRVHASSINAWDWDLLRGRPYLTRLGGLRKPRFTVIGADVAGRVEAVGRDVEGLGVGDAVFGDLSGEGWGGFAEYVCARAQALAAIPADVTFEQAAAVPQAAVLALQALRKGQLQSGQRVLIIGAGGGAGTFAVQFAKAAGAEVTGVDRGDKLDMLRSIGADHVIDYRQEDFSRTGQTYDLIVDVVVKRSIFDYKRALAPDGRFVVVGGTTGRILQVLVVGPLLSRLSGKKMGLLLHRPSQKDLEAIGEMLVSGKVEPVIDRVYPLERLSEAFKYFGAGNAKGKVVIAVSTTW
jgi:NADPH:quinone reductase-like Zn-dependent oxidoreductase